MRQKRSKTYRKLLSSYILHFNFRPPFQLLIDAPFTHSLAALHLTPQEVERRLSDVLQTSQLSKGKTRAGNPEMKCLITQCSMVQLYQAEKEGVIQKDAVAIAKSWERRRCNHREAIDADQCLKEVIGPNNKHRYLVASDSKALRHHLREQVAGLPLVHTNQSRVIVLEPMSDRTKARVEELEQAKLAGQGGSVQMLQSDDAPLGSNIVTEASTSNLMASEQTQDSSSKKRKVRGEANPLSNKKSKKVLEAEKAERERRTREIAQRTEMKRKHAELEEERKKVEEAAANETKDEAGVSQARRREDTDRSFVDPDGSRSGRTPSTGEGAGRGQEEERRKKRKRGGRGAGGKATTRPQGEVAVMSS